MTYDRYLPDARRFYYSSAILPPARSIRAANMTVHRALLLSVAFAGLVVGGDARGLAADDQPAEVARDPAVEGEVGAAIRALDDNDFTTRQRAASQLARWSGDAVRAPVLARKAAAVLVSAETSFEVRAQLERLLKQLPAAPADEASPPTAAEIPALFQRLRDDSCTVRDSAARRLAEMLRHPDLLAPIFVELKRRAAEPKLSSEGRRMLQPLLDAAREAWLLADPQTIVLPAPSDADVEQLVVELTTLDETEAADRFRREQAEHELLDLIARDDTRERVLKILKVKIDNAADGATTTTLSNVADFARPAMAAEVWIDRVNIFVQYLIIGVPQHNEGTKNPTHFDRIDDKTAHCVTGNSLSEGDYPVRIAIGYHDPGSDRMFYLTNLPTPRSRLLYEYSVKRDEAVRLREISQRTLDEFMARKKSLDESQILVLAQLDPHVTSKFAARYLAEVEDDGLVTSVSELNFQVSVHAGICYMLTRMGTHEVVPTLEKMARAGRFNREEGTLHMAWIAALAIAQRDPWPGVDQWLGSLLEDRTPLITNLDAPPQLGATAAAILLDHRGISSRPFGLDAIEAVIGQARFIGYRYSSDKDRDDILRWWKKASTANPAP